MTKESQRIAIAEACGWEWHNQPGYGYYVSPNKEDTIRRWEELPNYPEDLNAMHEAEKTLKGQQTVDYVYALRLIIETTDDLRTVHWFAVVHATASQRAEAFLKTIGKWKD